MRKIWLWSLVAGVVVLSGCGVLPQEEKVLSGDILQQNGLSGEVMVSHFPQCTPIQVRPFEDWEPIDIDKVAVNCRYEQGNIYFSSTDGLGGDCRMISIFEEGIFDDYGSDQVKSPVCELKGNEVSLWEPIGEYKALANFMKRHWLPEKKLIESAWVECTKRFDTDAVFQCGQSKLCKSLEGIGDYWEDLNWKNYFIFGTRPQWNSDFETYLVINDKIYDNGNLVISKNDDYYNITTEWSWVVSSIDWDKIVLKRYTEGKLKEPYLSRPELLENLWKKDDGKTIIWNYKVKTCEISL